MQVDPSDGRGKEDTSSVLGNYSLLFPIGSGGAGEVYVGLDRVRRIPVAVKVLKQSEQAIPEKALLRFQAEVSVLFRLRHPGVVSALDAGLDLGRFYLVMELCNGPSLQAVLNSVERLPLPQVLWLARQLATSLDYIHEQGVVHRDIKPSNLLLVEEGLKLTDFGIVHQEGEKLTQTGDAVGTPQFMSPEQIFGQQIDHRSDVFSTALVLYACLVGKPAFDGPVVTVMYHLVNTDAPPPSQVLPGLPPGLDAVFATALARDRAQRYYSVMELLGALQDALPGVRPMPVQLPPTLAAALATRAVLLKQKLTHALALLPPERLLAPDDVPTQYDPPAPMPSTGHRASPQSEGVGGGEARRTASVRTGAPPVGQATWSALPSVPDFPEEATDPGRAGVSVSGVSVSGVPVSSAPASGAPASGPSAQVSAAGAQASSAPASGTAGGSGGRPDIWEMPAGFGTGSAPASTPGNPWERAALAERAHAERVKAGSEPFMRDASFEAPQTGPGKTSRFAWKLVLIAWVAFGLFLGKFLLDEGVVHTGLTRPPLRLLPGGQGAEDPALPPGATPHAGETSALDAGAPRAGSSEGEGTSDTGTSDTGTRRTGTSAGGEVPLGKTVPRDAKSRSGVEVAAVPAGPVGFLRVKTTPAGKVLVDGAVKGSASGARIPLTVGVHTLTLKPQGTGKPVVRELEIREGRTVQLEYDFIEKAWRVPAGVR